MPSHYIKVPEGPSRKGPTTMGPFVVLFAFGSQRMLMRSLARLSLTAALLLFTALALHVLSTAALAQPGAVPGVEAAGGEGPDIAKMALITMGAILGAGAAGLVLYAIRQRIGFWLHRPPPREGGGGAEHH